MEQTQNATTQAADALVYSDLADLADRYDFFLVDCDGVLWIGEKAVDHSFAALDYLIQERNKKVFFITNATQRSRQTLMDKKLKQTYGFDKVPYTQLYTSAYMASQYLKRLVTEEGSMRKIDNPAVYVVGEVGLREELTEIGVRIINPEDYDDPAVSMSEEEAEAYAIDPSVVAVVCGINFTMSYRKVAIATMYVNENKAKLIGSNPDRNSGNEHRVIPAGGSCIKVIESATGVNAVFVGKPETHMFNLVREEHGITDTTKALMIGDNIATDIKFGSNSGIDTLLVLTGCTGPKKA